MTVGAEYLGVLLLRTHDFEMDTVECCGYGRCSARRYPPHYGFRPAL
ncbi:hypothetical protein ACIG56_07270 [Nocardia fusca]